MPRLLDESDGLGALPASPQLVPGRPGAVLEPMAGSHAHHRHQSNSLLSGVGITAEGEAANAGPIVPAIVEPLLNDTIAVGASVAAGLSTALVIVTPPPATAVAQPTGPITSTHIVVVYPSSSATLPIVMATGGTARVASGVASAVLIGIVTAFAL